MSARADMRLLRFIAEAGNGRDRNGRTVLDIGCGDGEFLEEALGVIPGWTTAFGIDPDPDSVAKASERFQDDMRVSFLEAGGDAIPLKASCVDIALMSKALHHLERPEAVLSEARRVLVPGGSFLVVEQSDDGGGHALWDEYHALRGRIDALKGLYMRPLYARAEIDALLSGRGLRKLRDAVLEWKPLEGEDALAGMRSAIRAQLAALPESRERDEIQGDASRTLESMRGRVVARPDLYMSEWEKENEDD